MKLKGIAIFVEDIDKAVTFYHGVFNLETAHRGENSASFMLNDFRVFLHQKMDMKEGLPPNEDHVEYEVEDLDKEIDRLKNEGFELELEPKKYYWGYSAYLRDPEGRMIE